MKIIRGTGDAKKMKGTAQTKTVATLRCTNCGQQAVQTRTASGDVIFKCVACGTELKTQKF